VAVKLALDTNRYTDLCQGNPEVVQLLEEAESIYVPFVVVAEWRAGISVGTKGRANERVLQLFLTKPGVHTLYATDATTFSYASLYRQLRQQGTPIPTHDLWIAALVVEHALVLYSRDEHFKNLPQLNML
jgi:tRNA(fMet)-specific endonuclease VapC